MLETVTPRFSGCGLEDDAIAVVAVVVAVVRLVGINASSKSRTSNDRMDWIPPPPYTLPSCVVVVVVALDTDSAVRAYSGFGSEHDDGDDDDNDEEDDVVSTVKS